jgi:catechol 2,3-dioxygenase-like lactoylglutathione lyase family enzyme
MKLDHVVVLVPDLAQAIQRWQEDGFTVIPGGVHADGMTHNALVCFADGSYVELLAFRQAPAAHRWARFYRFWGPIDYVIAAADVGAMVRDLRARDLPYADVVDGGRKRPDGEALRWRSAFPTDTQAALPFLIEDVTRRQLRVPAGDAVLHNNAASGIVQVRVDVPEIEPVARAYDALFGEPDTQPHARVYRLQGSRVTLNAPAAGSAEAQFIQQRGAGVVAITIGAPIPIVIKPAALQS